MKPPANSVRAVQDVPEVETRRAWWLYLLELLVASACLFTIADTVADPDIWGHLTFGHDILQTGCIRQQDRYSYLSDRPWINHEWLAELIFASTYQASGPSGLVVLKTALGLLVLGLGFRHLRREQLSPLASALLLLVVALALRPG